MRLPLKILLLFLSYCLLSCDSNNIIWEVRVESERPLINDEYDFRFEVYDERYLVFNTISGKLKLYDLINKKLLVERDVSQKRIHCFIASNKFYFLRDSSKTKDQLIEINLTNLVEKKYTFEQNCQIIPFKYKDTPYIIINDIDGKIIRPLMSSRTYTEPKLNFLKSGESIQSFDTFLKGFSEKENAFFCFTDDGLWYFSYENKMIFNADSDNTLTVEEHGNIIPLRTSVDCDYIYFIPFSNNKVLALDKMKLSNVKEIENVQFMDFEGNRVLLKNKENDLIIYNIQNDSRSVIYKDPDFNIVAAKFFNQNIVIADENKLKILKVE